MNRETYLIQAIAKLEPLFKRHGYTIPEVKVSVGLPGSRRGSKQNAIGQYWDKSASVDKLGSIFISPVLDDGIRVLDVLVHELVHAVVGVKNGHGPLFKKCAVSVGLTGPMRATAAGPELKLELESILTALGPYPHGRLNLDESPIKKQSTRMIKMECPECGFVCRASRSAIAINGPAICPCNNEPMKVEA